MFRRVVWGMVTYVFRVWEGDGSALRRRVLRTQHFGRATMLTGRRGA